MKNILMMIPLIGACSPEMYKTIDDIATQDAIVISVDRDALQKDTDIHIALDIKNKDK